MTFTDPMKRAMLGMLAMFNSSWSIPRNNSSAPSNSSSAPSDARMVEFPEYLVLLDYCPTDELHRTRTLQRSPEGKKERTKRPQAAIPSSPEHETLSPMKLRAGTNSSVDLPKSPPNMIALSQVDKNITWEGKMALAISPDSVTYSTPTGGMFMLMSDLTKAKVVKLSGILVTRVTPGKAITNLTEGDEWLLTPGSDDFLWINENLKQGYFEETQDNLYYYLLGLRPPNKDLVYCEYPFDAVTDLLRVGNNPCWAANNAVDFPKSDFQPTCPEPVTKDFLTTVNYIVGTILGGHPATPIPADNELVGAPALTPNPVFPPQSIRSRVESITGIFDVTVPLFLAYHACPVYRNMLAVATAKLFRTQTGLQTDFLFAVECAHLYNWALSFINITNSSAVFRAAFFVVSLLNMNANPDYFGTQASAQKDPVMATCLFMIISNMDPYHGWVWNVSDDAETRYKLPSIAEQLLGFRVGRSYNDTYAIIRENFDAVIAMVPNVLQRIRSNCRESDLKTFAWGRLAQKLFLVDASLYPAKSQFIALADGLVSWFAMLRFCADMANEAQNNTVSRYLSNFLQRRGPSGRLELARELAYRYVLNPENTTVNNILSWMPPYYSAYVADNLDSVKFPHKIVRRGDNQFNDRPCSDQLGWLLAWMSADWPSNRPLRIKCYQNYGEDYYMSSLSATNTIDFNGSTSLIFKAPFDGLNPADLSSVSRNGYECAAVQSQPDGTVSVHISKGDSVRYVFQIRKGVCALIGSNDKGGWGVNIPSQSGDHLLILTSPTNVDSYPKWISAAMTGLADPDKIQYALSGYQLADSDVLITIR